MSDTAITELYRVHRPKTLSQIVGQPDAVALLDKLLSDHETGMPHVMMFTGPTGSGKTTLAKIVAEQLGCTPSNITEMNCADCRAIDDVRAIRNTMGLAPMGGRCRVWILDEVVQLPKATQQAFLKILEEAPKHVWFLLCTSDTSGLLPTFMGRCFQVNLRYLSSRDIRDIIFNVLKSLTPSRQIDKDVLIALSEKANGNARQALLMLEGVLATDNKAKQLTLVGAFSGSVQEKIEFLARLLMQRKSWDEIVTCIEQIGDQEAEGIRRQVLAYCTKVMKGTSKLDQKQMAYAVIQSFRDHWMACGEAGLVSSCWECCHKKG